jgi:hypothetical protein
MVVLRSLTYKVRLCFLPELSPGFYTTTELLANCSLLFFCQGWPPILQGIASHKLHVDEGLISITNPTKNFWSWHLVRHISVKIPETLSFGDSYLRAKFDNKT